MFYAEFGWNINWTGGSAEEDKNVKSLQTDGRQAISFQVKTVRYHEWPCLYPALEMCILYS